MLNDEIFDIVYLKVGKPSFLSRLYATHLFGLKFTKTNYSKQLKCSEYGLLYVKILAIILRKRGRK